MIKHCNILTLNLCFRWTQVYQTCRKWNSFKSETCRLEANRSYPRRSSPSRNPTTYSILSLLGMQYPVSVTARFVQPHAATTFKLQFYLKLNFNIVLLKYCRSFFTTGVSFSPMERVFRLIFPVLFFVFHLWSDFFSTSFPHFFPCRHILTVFFIRSSFSNSKLIRYFLYNTLWRFQNKDFIFY